MTDHAALGMRGICVELTGQQARGTGADQHLGARGGADPGVQLALEVEALGRAFLDEIGIAYAVLDAVDEAQALQRGTCRQALFLQRRPGIGQTGTQRSLGPSRRIPGDHVEVMGQGAGDPAGADDAGAEGSEGLDIGNEGHGELR